VKRLVVHLIAFLVAVTFAVVFYIKTLDMPQAAYELPRLLSYLITILAGAMLFEAFIYYRKQLKSGEAESKEEVKVVRIILFVLMIGIYIATIEKIGYFIMTPLFLIGAFFYLKSVKRLTIVFITAGFTIFIYILFVKLLNSPIPMGLLS